MIITFLLKDPFLAYMDPGSGSLLLQLLLGGAAGALVFVKLFWSRLTGLFRRNAEEKERISDSTGSSGGESSL